MNNNRYRTGVLSLLVGVLLPMSMAYAEQGDWLVRLRGIAVAPNDDSSQVSLNNTALPGTGVEVDTQGIPEIDVTYMFHRHWGVELIAGTAEHNVNLQGNIGPVVSGTKLFDTWVLPPTVTLQYHFFPDKKFRPYIGAGANFTTFIDENASPALESALGTPVSVKMDNSWGWALQAGMDIDIKNNWFFNFDIKYIDIDSTAKLDFGPNRLSVDVDVDPWVAGAGVGYRF